MNKKILIIINNLGIGGAERLVVDDVNEMLRTGIDVSLITLRPEYQKSFATALKLGPDGFHCIPFKHFFDILAWVKIFRTIMAFKPDLVITQLWFANTVGRIAATIASVKRIISFEQNVYDTVKTRKMFFMDWLLQSLSTKIIAVSGAVKESLIRHNIAEKRIEIVHNSIDLKPYNTIYDKVSMRESLGIPQESFLFIFVGRLIRQKAVDILLEAFKHLDKDSYLLIVGEGKEREALEKIANGRVVFAGIKNNIPELLYGADCFVLPSRYEGLPLVLVEALARGMAIIVSDFEAAKEIITHEKNGLIVPRENVEALAQAMIRIHKDGALRERLALEAKKLAEQFSISSHVRAILRYTNL